MPSTGQGDGDAAEPLGLTARERLRPHLAPALTLFAFAVAGFWTLIAQSGSRFWSDTGDGTTFVWAYWRTLPKLLSLENPFVAEDILYPIGARTVFHTGVPMWSILAGVLEPVIGLTRASVVVGMLAVVLSGLAVYALALQLGCARWMACFAGVAYELLPWRTNRIITHLNLIHTEFLVLAVLVALLLCRRVTWVRGAALGAVLGGAILTDFTVTILTAFAAGLVFAVHWRATLTRRMAAALGVAAATAVVIGALVLIPAIGDVRSGEFEERPGLNGAQGFSADVMSYVYPYIYHPIWGSSVAERATPFGGERMNYLGPILAALAVVGALTRSRERLLLLVVAVTSFLLSLGPGLQFNGWTGSRFSYDGFRFSVPLPYLLLHQLPIVSGLRAPSRFGAILGIAVVVLAAIGLQRIATRWTRLATVLPFVAMASVFVDFLPPRTFLNLPEEVPAVYEEMAADLVPGAVLDIPLQVRDGYVTFGDARNGLFDHSIYMYYATRHERPISSATLARVPSARIQALQEVPVYADVFVLQGDLPPEQFDGDLFDADDLRELGIRYVVYHKGNPQPEVRLHVESIDVELVDEDPNVAVWRVPDA